MTTILQKHIKETITQWQKKNEITFMSLNKISSYEQNELIDQLVIELENTAKRLLGPWACL